MSRHSDRASWETLFDRVSVPAGPPVGRSRALGRYLAGCLAVALAVSLLVAPFVVGPALAARTAASWWDALPTDVPLDDALPLRTVLTDRDGHPFATLLGENRTPVSLAQVSPYVVAALLSTEDDRFYDHGAVDPRGLLRAFVTNQASTARQGGSTITQQYVKNLLLSNAVTDQERDEVTAPTLERKLREARLAFALEQRLSKDQILEGYLNTVNFGNGAYGIGAASRRYFSVAPSALTVQQAATLVALLKSPVYYNPLTRPASSQRRRDVVLARMRETGRISAAVAAQAMRTPTALRMSQTSSGCAVSRYPFYCSWVKQVLETDPVFGATAEARQQNLYRGGYTIRTALDPAAMAAAETAARRALTARNRVATGVAVVEPGTGAVAALATNRPWGQDIRRGQTELTYATLPSFQPGSTFKAFTLAAALEQGFPLSTTYPTPNGYKPAGLNYPSGGFHNDDDRDHGTIDAYTATAQSVNTWFVRLEQRTGVLAVADMARRLGITSLVRSGPQRITARDGALTLGTAEVSPLQMAAAYATFAADGVACRPIAILSMTDRTGASARIPSAGCHQAITPAVAAQVTSLLEAPFGAGGTAAGVRLDRPAAGKTGTTDDSAATWFVGYTPQYATAVWVGDPRGGQSHPLHDVTAYGTTYGTVYGGTIAGPVWRDTMTALHRRLPVEPLPSDQGLVPTPVVVPDVRGMGRDEAITVLVREGFRVRVSPDLAPSDGVAPAGYVAGQSPAAGGAVLPGATVTLVLTAGSDPQVVVPTPTS